MYQSSKAAVCQSVPNSSETTGSYELNFLKDDSPWDADGIRLNSTWISPTDRQKTKKKYNNSSGTCNPLIFTLLFFGR